MNKKSLTERDICSKFISPSLQNAGWDMDNQVREEVYFTDGRIVVRKNVAKRAKGKKADYILYYKPNLPLAVIEAKDNNHSLGSGMQQALDYAEILDIPFVYTSNGDAFLEHDRTKAEGQVQMEITLQDFPSPAQLWDRYKQAKSITDDIEPVIIEDYYYEPRGKKARYYQQVAINKVVEAIVQGQNRLLLVMATGTGKTFTAFQIIYKLWKTQCKKRILFLADRNILIDQTRQNDFKYFGDRMTKIKNRVADPAYEIYLALYQAVSGEEEFRNIYKEFSPDFFDLIVIDECHRGSAKEDSAWREILTYFHSATQIGMTATPKETKDTSNIEYFGEPIYTYSLKQGIDDGFLAPYKVVRVSLDKDLEGWRPPKGKQDKYGNEIADREYNITDYDRTLVLEKRTELVAKRVSDYLKNNNERFAKTIFFCTDIDHAIRMCTALVNENADLFAQNHNYIMRITGDNPAGKAQLENFINPYEPYPVLVTTSKLLTTGVDAQPCKYIVLDTNINSMTEFKQIIGRGTRICDDCDKMYFTIIDFRNNSRNFADPSFDGEPEIVKVTLGDIPLEADEEGFEETEHTDGSLPPDIGIDDDTTGNRVKYYVGDVPVNILNERVLYYGADGKLITESLVDYSKKNILNEFLSLDDFLQKWNAADKKAAIIEELREKGIFIDELQDEVGKDLDPFDLICHIAFDMKPLTRKERAEKVKKKNYFAKYGDQVRSVLEALLEKYAAEGIENLEETRILTLPEFAKFGSLKQIIGYFGNKDGYKKAISELEKELYVA